MPPNGHDDGPFCKGHAEGGIPVEDDHRNVGGGSRHGGVTGSGKREDGRCTVGTGLVIVDPKVKTPKWLFLR